MHLESWGELMSAQQLWNNATLEVGFGPTADAVRALVRLVYVYCVDRSYYPSRLPDPARDPTPVPAIYGVHTRKKQVN